MPQKRLTRQTVKIGFFTLLAIGILYLGITYLKGLSISARSKTYYVAMNDVTGINVATRVFVNGYKVGSVRGMKYDYHSNGETILTLPAGTPITVDNIIVTENFIDYRSFIIFAVTGLLLYKKWVHPILLIVLAGIAGVLLYSL